MRRMLRTQKSKEVTLLESSVWGWLKGLSGAGQQTSAKQVHEVSRDSHLPYPDSRLSSRTETGMPVSQTKSRVCISGKCMGMQ